MYKLSKEYVTSFYETSLHMYGDRPEAVRWTRKGQQSRFASLLEIDENIKGKKVLDYGCGKGDFFQYLKDRGIDVQYTGFDISEKMISLARKKHPEACFSVFDVEQEALKEDYDYVFLCGVFNLKLSGLIETIESVLTRLFSRCRIALAFNALSSYEPRKAHELHYLSPEDIFGFVVKNLSPFVSLVHDRIPHDFTIFVRRNLRVPAHPCKP